jgi:hypothetical protein
MRLDLLEAVPANPNVGAIRILSIEGVTIVPSFHGSGLVIGIAVAVITDARRAKATMIVRPLRVRSGPPLPDERDAAPAFCLPNHAFG